MPIFSRVKQSTQLHLRFHEQDSEIEITIPKRNGKHDTRYFDIAFPRHPLQKEVLSTIIENYKERYHIPIAFQF